MARKKKKLTANQELFKKQQQRLQRAIKRGEKAGLIFDENLIPAMPKRVTKQALEKITAIKPKDLRENAVYLDKETGEVIPYNEYYEQVKEERRKKRKEQREKTKKETSSQEPETLPQEPEPSPQEPVSDEKTQTYTQDENVYENMSEHMVNEFLEYMTHMPKEIGEPIANFIKNLMHNTSVDNIAKALSQINESVWDIFERCNYSYEETVVEYTGLLVSNLPFDSLEGITEDELRDNREYWYEQFENYTVGSDYEY